MNMMMKYDKPISPLLLTDFYKICHRPLYKDGTEQLVLYWTPRKSRIEGVDKVVMIGLQLMLKKYFIDYFNIFFFNEKWENIYNDFTMTIGPAMSFEIAEDEIAAFKELWELGYLPIEINAIEEGKLVPIGCPMIEYRITNKRFFWLDNYFETLMSVNLWFPMTTATIAYNIRTNVVNPWYDKTVDDDVPRSSACGDFSMRGMTSPESAAMGDLGHALSFSSTATVPTIHLLRQFYHGKGTELRGVPSSEHSVAESYGPENELEYFEHIIETIPNGPLSIVSDTWDIWNVLTNYMPKLKDKIMARNGRVVIRPDSGDPADIICGTLDKMNYQIIEGLTEDGIRKYVEKIGNSGCYKSADFRFRIGDYLYDVNVDYAWVDDDECSMGGYYTEEIEDFEVVKSEITCEMRGVIHLLDNVCGHTINSKGYKVLDSHFGIIYGDAITFTKAKEIYERLAKMGWASNNVILGIGSYTYQYVTRDSLGFALKVTDGIINGVEKPMFKDPITDRKAGGESFKKSQKGLYYVIEDENGNLSYTDGWNEQTIPKTGNMLKPVFRNGELLRDFTIEEIRNTLHKGKF